MCPKEKAKELVKNFIEPTKVPNIKHIWVEDIDAAKQCALIAVDEIIKSEELNYLFSKEEINSMEFTSDSMWVYERFIGFWEEVKKEISSYENE